MHEVLAQDRRRYERLLLSRMGTTLSREDAEDVVSEALIRVQGKAESDPPQAGKEEAWFARIVLNQGIDFIRARDGRRREGSTPRPAVVSLTHIDEDLRALSGESLDETLDLQSLADAHERRQARELVNRVLAALDPKDAELVKLRHLVGGRASREQLAAMAGLTVGEFRWRYAKAWSRFVEAVGLDAPTPRCERVRQLLGELEAGTAPPDAAAEVDAHTLDCASCRVFARESYRALELIPFVPVIGVAERWSARIGWWWERSGPETAAGAGGAAAGAGALAAAGGTAGALKAIAAFCSATAITASVCAGVVVVLDGDESRKSPRAERAQRSPVPTATAQPTTTATPDPAPAATAQPERQQRREESRSDTSGESEIPASAPAGASEFTPTASTASAEPAPATSSGGGEFTP